MHRLSQFLKRNFGEIAKLTPFASKVLPPLFAKYELVKVDLNAAMTFIALIDKQKFPTRVKQAIGHEKWASELLGLHAVYVSPRMDRLMRFRMREKHAEYIDLSCEVFLPSLGLVICEQISAPRPVRTTLGIPAQRILLAKLNHFLIEPITAQSLRGQFGYSNVTIIEALKELELQGLIHRERLSETRKLLVVFDVNGKELWSRTQSMYTSPVLEKVAVDELPEGFIRIPSGETALAMHSSLNAPAQEVFAFYGSASERKQIKARQVILDDGKYAIEFWRHPPLLPGATKLDPLTTILVTLDIAHDERVAGEHEEILEAFKW